jgi:hypothetical protein
MPDAARRCKSRRNQMIREFEMRRLAERTGNSLLFRETFGGLRVIERDGVIAPRLGDFSTQVQIATIGRFDAVCNGGLKTE